MATERLNVKPGAGFDPTNKEHVQQVLDALGKAGDQGTGWSMQSYNPDTGMLTLQRQSAVTQVLGSGKRESYEVALMQGTKPTDGEKVAAQLESDPSHAGYFLTKFDPYVGTATLSRMTLDARRCRAAVATAMGVKPWDVQVKTRAAGGFAIGLPNSYVPSKHENKLQEVADSVIGKLGWYFEANASKLTAAIIPADPPVFETVYPFRFEALPAQPDMNDPDLWRIPLGESLGGRGIPNAPLVVDLADSVGSLTVGLAGSGKSVATQAVLFSAMARGWDIALINTADKATDFVWAKPYVKENMWGCDSVAQAVTVAKLVGEEGSRRGELLSRYGVSKWQDLPADVRAENPPLLLVADELAALLTADPLPSGLSKEMKELPEFIQMQQDLLESKLLATALSTIPAVYRAAGIRVNYLTQQPNERYGFSTKLKGNLPHRVMLGVNPSQQEKGHAFRTPEKVPDVPSHIAQNDQLSRGVGLAHLDGQEPVVFKGYFAPLDTYIAEAQRRGFRTTLHPEPTPGQIARLVPRIDGEEGEAPEVLKEPKKKYGAEPRKAADMEAWELDPETGKPLSGFARASQAMKQATVDAKQE